MADRYEAMAAIYDQHADALFGFLLNLTRRDAEARDLLQALFVKIAGRRPEPLAGVAKPRAYLLTAAHRIFIDQRRSDDSRRRALGRFADEQEPAFFEQGSRDEGLRDRAELLIAGLPDEQRTVVHLKIWEEMSFSEIGEVIGVSKATAASRYRYALEKLRVGFGEELELLKG